MSIWDKLLKVSVKNNSKFQRIFVNTIKKVKNNSIRINAGEIKKQDYYLITQENNNGHIIYIVPKELYALFKEISKAAPQEFLGFSVLTGKYKNKEVRVSGFGIKCNLLGKALFKNKRPNKRK